MNQFCASSKIRQFYCTSCKTRGSLTVKSSSSGLFIQHIIMHIIIQCALQKYKIKSNKIEIKRSNVCFYKKIYI